MHYTTKNTIKFSNNNLNILEDHANNAAVDDKKFICNGIQDHIDNEELKYSSLILSNNITSLKSKLSKPPNTDNYISTQYRIKHRPRGSTCDISKKHNVSNDELNDFNDALHVTSSGTYNTYFALSTRY